MTLPVLNLALLSNIVTWAVGDYADDQVLKEKFAAWGSWNQGAWAQTNIFDPASPAALDRSAGLCGSTYCIAGQTVAQVGYRLNFPSWGDYMGEDYHTDAPIKVDTSYCVPVVFDGLDDKGNPKYKEVGGEQSISHVAKEALGLTQTEADALFDGANEIGRVVALARQFAAARGKVLDVPQTAHDLADEYLNSPNGQAYLSDNHGLLWWTWDEESSDFDAARVIVQRCRHCGGADPLD